MSIYQSKLMNPTREERAVCETSATSCSQINSKCRLNNKGKFFQTLSKQRLAGLQLFYVDSLPFLTVIPALLPIQSGLPLYLEVRSHLICVILRHPSLFLFSRNLNLTLDDKREVNRRHQPMQIIVTKSSRANITLNTYFIKRRDITQAKAEGPKKESSSLENSKVCRFFSQLVRGLVSRSFLLISQLTKRPCQRFTY